MQSHLDKVKLICLDQEHNDGIDVVDCLEEDHTLADLLEHMTIRAQPAETFTNDRSRIVRSSAYDREVGQHSLDYRIESNKVKTSEKVD